MESQPIYLDYQATTPVDPRVMNAMTPFFTSIYGNAASNHFFGRKAAEGVAVAREQVAAAIGADPMEVIFTSGATESINLALKGLCHSRGKQKPHLITCVSEHPAVMDCLRFLEIKGYQLTVLGVDHKGHLDLESLAAQITPQTLMISLMYANNETGVLHNVVKIGALAKARGVFFHCDAAQAAGKEPIDVHAMGIDLLSISGHKVYGPKGIGALYIRRKEPRVRLIPQMHGGGHERRFRSGTLNVPAIVGLGTALTLAEYLGSPARDAV